MPLESIHSFLVRPGKGVAEQPVIRGATIPAEGNLFSMLDKLHNRAPIECEIEMVFRPDEGGAQHNACAALLGTFIRRPSLETGFPIAERLQVATTNRSGMGLLFLLKGRTAGGRHTLVISRFPADEGVVARESHERLSVEFVEQVFMKNSRAYKSALYTTDSLEIPFTDGRAIDRQMSDAEVRDYWITEFLDCQLRTTSAAGSRRLAVALQHAVRTAPTVEVKQELVAAATLMRGHSGRVVSADGLVQQLGLSDAAVDALSGAFPRQETYQERFRFDFEEFGRYAAFRAVELSNGAILMAENARFDQVFERVEPAQVGFVRYMTEGQIVNERLKKTS